ncbi:hypothetical protein, partial [Novosphingobium clariflavum]|uniref:hypothetical protein n=1 Tax=Novosphingobium clariflavum TaxID=2029884 RepID=UPI0022640879
NFKKTSLSQKTPVFEGLMRLIYPSGHRIPAPLSLAAVYSAAHRTQIVCPTLCKMPPHPLFTT